MIIFVIILFICGIYVTYKGYNMIDLPITMLGVMFIFLGILASIMLIDNSNKQFKPEYQIELLNQEDVVIKTKKSTDTISFDYLEEYIIHDNL